MRHEAKNGAGYFLNNLRGQTPKIAGRGAIDVTHAAPRIPNCRRKTDDMEPLRRSLV
jgi:hypothetical protein